MTYMRSLSICIDSVTSANGFIGAPVESTRCTVFAIDGCPPFESSGDRIVGGIRNCGFYRFSVSADSISMQSIRLPYLS